MRMLERWGRAEDVAATRWPGRLSLSLRVSINDQSTGTPMDQTSEKGKREAAAATAVVTGGETLDD